VLVAGQQLVVGTYGAVRGASALSVAASSASARWGSALGALATSAPTDAGFSIEGFAGAPGRPGTLFVKVSDDATGRACFDAVAQRITAAKRG
jgi:hypothetical protein